MAERQPGWKEALREPNAIGWIGLIIVVIAIGFGAVYFGNGNSQSAGHETTGQVVR